jgi:hypothetical protein
MEVPQVYKDYIVSRSKRDPSDPALEVLLEEIRRLEDLPEPKLKLFRSAEEHREYLAACEEFTRCREEIERQTLEKLRVLRDAGNVAAYFLLLPIDDPQKYLERQSALDAAYDGDY